MTKTEKIDRLRVLEHAYILYGMGTRMPFIECEQGNYFDQAFLYEKQEDAQEAAKRFYDNGDLVAVVELKTEGVIRSSEEGGQENASEVPRNQVREHLLHFPLLGLNAVFFKPEGESGEVLELDQVIPSQVKEVVDKAKTELTGLRLTGLYYAQDLRRKDPDMNQIQEHSEEFYANLIRAELLLPVMPEEEPTEDGRLNLAKSRIPLFPIKKKDTGETASFLAFFTNMSEVSAYCKKVSDKVKVVKIPFKDVAGMLNESVVGCVIDPLSLCIPVAKNDIPKLVEELKL